MATRWMQLQPQKNIPPLIRPSRLAIQSSAAYFSLHMHSWGIWKSAAQNTATQCCKVCLNFRPEEDKNSNTPTKKGAHVKHLT